MPRKTSIKKSAVDFTKAADEIANFLSILGNGQSAKHISWLHDYAIIRLYREFEALMLDSLAGAINNDLEVFSDVVGVEFPKHLKHKSCEYLIVGTGYFDFKGKSGLVKTLKKFVPANHYLLTVVKKTKYHQTLEQLSALRNFAAHDSAKSKKNALRETGQQRLKSSGTWLKTDNRIRTIISKLKELAAEIETESPF